TVSFFSSRRRHTRSKRDWSSDVCSSDLLFLLHLDHHPNHVDTCEDENPNYIKEVPVQADDEYFSGCHCSQPMLFQLDKDCYHPADTQGNVDTVRTRQCKET